uniref:beta-N-acetylhexosaminidase n=1 Tax=uncultured Veillonella sp. TaxID=159268 RepID=A0A060C343_9FIRM|nr:CAZy families GH3 protein [uncultured Veillonella sp.]
MMTDILRGTCGYQGLILSDDMEMGAMAKHYAFSDMGVMAIKAGADIVLVCHDYGHEKETFEGCCRHIKQTRISKAGRRKSNAYCADEN